MMLRASIVIGTLAESIDTMMIEVLAHIKLFLIVYDICVNEVVIFLFVAKMLNVMLLVTYLSRKKIGCSGDNGHRDEAKFSAVRFRI